MIENSGSLKGIINSTGTIVASGLVKAGPVSYLHIKFSSTYPVEKLKDEIDNWIGIYTDLLPEDSSDIAKYQWFKIKGEQGIQGPPGTVEIIDNLVSTEAGKALSANQGKKLKQTIDKITELRKSIILTSTIANNAIYTLPICYMVGDDSLQLYWNGVLLIKGENYTEVGTNGTSSTKVKMGFDWEIDDELTAIVKGGVLNE